ncbi:hypothetical protein CDEN61S_02435 [Castellaniella denitrificans]
MPHGRVHARYGRHGRIVAARVGRDVAGDPRVDAGRAAVVRADRAALVAQQLEQEQGAALAIPGGDVQVPGHERRLVDPGVLAQPLQRICRHVGIGPQGLAVIALREGADRVHQGGEFIRRGPQAQPVVIPGVRRRGRQRPDGIAGARVVQDRGLQGHAVEVHAILVQDIGQHGAAGCAVGFAEQELGRVPAVVFGQVALDELLQRGGVLVHAPEITVLPRRDGRRIARPDRIDEHQVAAVEQAVGVVFQRVGRGRREIRHGRPDAPGRERAQQHEDRRRAGPAVVEEGDRPLVRRVAVQGEGDVEDLRAGARAAGVHGDQMAGTSRVGQRPAVQAQFVMGHRGAFRRIRHGIVRAIAVGRRIEIGLGFHFAPPESAFPAFHPLDPFNRGIPDEASAAMEHRGVRQRRPGQAPDIRIQGVVRQGHLPSRSIQVGRRARPCRWLPHDRQVSSWSILTLGRIADQIGESFK